MSRLLLVSDQLEQMNDLLFVAKQVGFAETEIVTATSEDEADARIESQRFDIAVVDIMLSVPAGQEEGLRVIARLAETCPKCRVIGLTTYDQYDGAKVLKAGAHDFVGTYYEEINWLALLSERLRLWKGFVGWQEGDKRGETRVSQPKVPSRVGLRTKSEE